MVAIVPYHSLQVKDTIGKYHRGKWVKIILQISVGKKEGSKKTWFGLALRAREVDGEGDLDRFIIKCEDKNEK
jgi:hypothetical protein